MPSHNGKTKSRLLVLLPNLGGGGIERLTLNLIQSIASGRYDVTLLVHEKHGPLVGMAESVTHVRYISSNRYSRWRLPLLLLETFRELRRADVCLAVNEGRAAMLGLICARWLNVPIVGVINFDWRTYVSDKANSWRQLIGLRLYRYMTLNVAVSEGAADGLRHFVNLKNTPVHVITVPQIVSEVQARARQPVPPNMSKHFSSPTVVAVGRLTYQKGLDFLIEAHARLITRGITHKLILVGDGDSKRELAVLANKLGVEDSVVFAGYQSNPLPFVNAATVFAFPSRSEGLGLALAEALICGAAIVASDCLSGQREMLDGGNAGILVEVGDIEALANGIGRLLLDSKLREKLRSNARQRGLMFDHEIVGRQWQEVLDKAEGAVS